MKNSEIKNWLDIPRDLYFGGYKVNCSMENLANMVADMAEGHEALELEPDFQRHHVWNDAQRTAYVEYVLRGGLSSCEIYFNSPNWLGSGGNYGEGTFQLVDGLQRYTAITKFINNEIPAFGCLYNEREGKTRGHQMVVAVNNLATRKEVLEWYLLLNDGGVNHTRDELDRVRDLLEKED